MNGNRRDFLKQAGLGLAASGIAGSAVHADYSSSADTFPEPDLAHQGPKVVRGKKAVASSQHPIVTETMLDVMRTGGNAVDAAIAGAITQATIQLDMTNHSGTIGFLYWEAKTGKTYQLNGMGTLAPDLPPCRPLPPELGALSSGTNPMACVPGFMPAVGEIHRRFATKPWKALVEYAIPWAENGHHMDEFTRSVLGTELLGNTFYPSMREIYAPEGFSPSVGELWKNPKLARTLRRLAHEGPEYFTKGEWAHHFVEAAHSMNWNIKIEDLSSNPPRWVEPMRWPYKGYEIVQLAPPERQGLFCNMVMGILKHLDIASLGHYTESADTLYYMAHAMRRADFELGQLYDPEFFGVPVDVWTSDEYHANLAKILRTTRPKRGVDLTKHVELTSNISNLRAFGWTSGTPDNTSRPPTGSCELSCVDADGNWVQMMDTLQSGGIPGLAVDGVPMMGSGAQFTMDQWLFGWLGLPGSRMRCALGNTIVFRDGKPYLSMGSPGNVFWTVPQMLTSILDFGKDPYEAAVMPRMKPIRGDYTIEIETRIPENVLRDLVKLGVKLSPLPSFDVGMGSYQQAWRDPHTGLLNASTDPRRAGRAGGF